MADNPGPTVEATLYDAANYGGTAVSVEPDKWDEDGEALAYALAYLGLNRLGSLRAPPIGPGDLDHPFRQELRWVTHVTVWESKPDTWVHNGDERGRIWQDYSADTADLGLWAAKAKYVRVWKQRGDALSDSDFFGSDGAIGPIAIVE